MQSAIQTQGSDRRGAIRYALFRCILERGYSATTLADVAAGAGLTPSHLLYYFPNKDAVLEDLFEVLARNMMDDIQALPGKSAADGLEAFTEYFFGGNLMTRPEIGMMLEMFGLSAHNRKLWETKSRFDRECKQWLEATVRPLCRGAEISAADIAETVFALMVGLLTDSYFDERIDREHARKAFSTNLARLVEAPDNK